MAQTVQRAKLPDALGALLVFTEGTERGRQFPLVFTRTIVGRTKGDVLIKDLAVSSKHLVIDYRRGKFHVIDLESKNGTFLNEKKIRDHHVFIDQDIRIGDSLFHIELDPEKAKTLFEQQSFLASPNKGLKELIQEEFFNVSLEQTRVSKPVSTTKDQKKYIKVKVTLKNGKAIKLKYVNQRIYIGREDVELVLQDIEVSRKHAMLERLENNQVILQDLASANGTFVNGKRIERMVLMKEDLIRIGETEIQYLGVFQ